MSAGGSEPRLRKNQAVVDVGMLSLVFIALTHRHEGQFSGGCEPANSLRTNLMSMTASAMDNTEEEKVYIVLNSVQYGDYNYK